MTRALTPHQWRRKHQHRHLHLTITAPGPKWSMDPIRRADSARRSLFGPVDHDQLRRDLKQRMMEMMEEDRRRWNFDFHTDTPLPGRFEWEEIPTDCAAHLYQAQLRDAGSLSRTEDDDSDHDGAGDRLSHRDGSTGTDQENCPSISNTHKCPAEVTPVRRKRSHSKAAAKPKSDPRITGKEPKS